VAPAEVIQKITFLIPNVVSKKKETRMNSHQGEEEGVSSKKSREGKPAVLILLREEEKKKLDRQHKSPKAGGS